MDKQRFNQLRNGDAFVSGIKFQYNGGYWSPSNIITYPNHSPNTIKTLTESDAIYVKITGEHHSDTGFTMSLEEAKLLALNLIETIEAVQYAAAHHNPFKP